MRWLPCVMVVGCLVGCACGRSTSDVAAQEAEAANGAAGEVVPLREYHGRVHVFMATDADPALHVLSVIRDQAAYEAFCSRIPEQQLMQVPSPPPSNDPLLQRPPIDWESEMLLVASRSENMHVGCRIMQIVQANDGSLDVRVDLDPIGDTPTLASVLGVGRYHAVVVPRTAGEVRTEFVQHND